MNHSRAVSWLLAAVVTTGITGSATATSSLALTFELDEGYCDLMDAPGLRTIHVMHTYNYGVRAARFGVQAGPGMTMSYVSETSPFQVIGNSQTGITICYGGECLEGQQYVLTMTYMGYGTSTSNCTKLLLVPFPGSQVVETLDCASLPQPAYVRDLYVHRFSGCGCPDYHSFAGVALPFSCVPVSVATSTWGAIKALYR